MPNRLVILAINCNGLVRTGIALQNLRSCISVMLIMIDLRCKTSFLGVCLMAVMGSVYAADPVITWPAGWQAQPLAQSPDAAQSRQRGGKNDELGNPLMVMELTRSRLQAGHEVNVEGVLLEMRKAIQVDFVRSGFQSVCTRVRPTRLGDVAALETTCTVTQNGVHLMTQTLVAAANKEMAWSLSYAGSTDGYTASKAEALQIRDSLRLTDVE